MQNFRAKPGHADGGVRGAGAGGADDRLRHRPPGDGAADVDPGPAEPVRRLRAAAAGGDQRLGRGLPPHPRLREPGGPLAGHRPPRGADRRRRLRPPRAAHRLPRVPRATTTGSTRACAATSAPSPTTTASPCPAAPPRWRWRRERHLLPHRPRRGAARRPRPRPGGRRLGRRRRRAGPRRRPAAGRDGRGRRPRPRVGGGAGRGDGAPDARRRPAGGSPSGPPATGPPPSTPSSAPGRRSCAPTRDGAGGGDRARLAAGDRHPRVGRGGTRGGGPRRDRRRRRRPRRRGLGPRTEVARLRDAIAPRALVERTALPVGAEIDDARARPRPPPVHRLARPGRRLRRQPPPLHVGARPRRGPAGAGAAAVGGVGGRRLAGRDRGGGPRPRSTRTSRGSSSGASPAPRRGWRRSSASSGPAATRWRPSRRSPTTCAAAATATGSPTSSTGTSTTPTSATSAAASAASAAARRA